MIFVLRFPTNTVVNISRLIGDERAQRHKLVALSLASDIPHGAAYRLGRLVLHQDFGGARKIIRSLFAARIVNDDAQIRFRGGAQPRLNHLPRREKVAGG